MRWDSAPEPPLNYGIVYYYQGIIYLIPPQYLMFIEAETVVYSSRQIVCLFIL